MPRRQRRGAGGGGLTFNVVDDGDYVLSEQLRGTPVQWSSLNMLKDGAKLLILFGGLHEILRQLSLLG